MKEIYLVLSILILFACSSMSQTESGNRKLGEKEKTKLTSTPVDSKKSGDD